MKLPLFLEKISHKRVEEKEYFLALEIKDKEVKVAIWQRVKEKITLINIGRAPYLGDWDEVIKAADEAIVEASADINQEEIEKVIFGVSLTWTSENRILNPHLENLKKLCGRLSLKPLGFVTTPEAVVARLKQIEGIPPTALLIGVEEAVLVITLVKAGRMEGTRTLEKKKEKALPEQIEEVIAGFSVEILPSRILLYDGEEDLEKIKGEILSYRFNEKLPFLHLPKVEILDKDFDIKALALTSGVQMGGAVPIEEILMESKPGIEEEKVVQPPEEEKEEVSGFIKGKDILEEKEGETLIGKEEARVESSRTEFMPEEPKKSTRGGLKLLSFFKLKFPSLNWPQLNLPFPGEFKRIGFVLVFVLVIIAGFSFAAYWYLPKAEVKVWVQTQPLEKELEIIITQSSKVGPESFEKMVGEMIEVEETASEKTSTTGKKMVGDPAKGKAIIYNKTENEKKFPSGTILTGSEGLRFSLDEEVIVASTTAFSTSFSSVSGKVTAVKIGLEGNLSAGTNFSFKDYPTSSYFAKNEEDFSGGTSQEILVVAKSDQEKLTESLSKKLAEKAKEDLRGKLGPGEKLLEETLTSTVKEKKFDKEVDEETSELNLDLTTLFKVMIYSEKELKDRLFQNMREATPQGYELNPEEIKIEILGVEKKEEEVTLKITAKASLLPKLDLEEIKKNITGKKQIIAEEYLKNLAGATQVEILIRFPLPLPLQTLPRLPQNIKLEIIST